MFIERSDQNLVGVGVYKHGPPGGGRIGRLIGVYKHSPPGGGRIGRLIGVYEHGPPDGGRRTLPACPVRS